MNLDEIPCKTWAELVEYLPEHKILLLLSKDERGRQVVKYLDEHGVQCASAIVCAMLASEVNNAISMAHWALDVYRRICPDRTDEWVDFDFYLAWAGIPRELKWTIEPEFATEGEEAGMANVMFSFSLEGFMMGSTSDKLAGMKVAEFLEEGMIKKRSEE